MNDPLPPASDRLLFQEVAFSASMGVVAVFSRDNPLLLFPQVLWAFAALLLFNLAYHVLLRRHGDVWLVPMVSIAANAVLISAILAYSGGRDSYFWPMYMLPVFTACLYLEPRHVVFAVAAPVAFLTLFYLDLVLDGPVWQFLELGVKAGVLGLSAGVTGHISIRERRARAALEAARHELDVLAKEAPPRGKAIKRFFDGVVYDIHSQLFVLMGSAEMMRERLPKDSDQAADLARIERSAESLNRLTGELLSMTNEDEDRRAPVALELLLRSTLALLDYKVEFRRLTVRTAIAKDLPDLALSRAHIQQVLLELCLLVFSQTPEGSEVSVLARPVRSTIQLTIDMPWPPGTPAPPVASFQKSLAAQECKLTLRDHDGLMSLLLVFPAPVRAGQS